MFRNLPFFTVSILFFSSCNYASVNVDKAEIIDQAKVNPKSDEVKKPVPVWGYRFAITGEFDGDGRQEKLTEYYFNGLANKETNKFYNVDYDYDVKMAHQKQSYSFIGCDNKSISGLSVASVGDLGLLYLKNEGDLDGDGGDEVSYVTNKADWSSLNECSIMTYKRGKWVVLYWFPIWEWQLPKLPRAGNQGISDEGKRIAVNSDTTNQRPLNDLTAFKGLVKKAGRKKIKIIYRSKNISQDTIIVKLKDRHPPL